MTAARKLNTIEHVEGAEHLEAKLNALDLFKILLGRKGRYWCTIAADRPEAVVVLSASGGKKGHASALEAFEAAMELAIPRVPELNNPEGWVK